VADMAPFLEQMSVELVADGCLADERVAFDQPEHRERHFRHDLAGRQPDASDLVGDGFDIACEVRLDLADAPFRTGDPARPVESPRAARRDASADGAATALPVPPSGASQLSAEQARAAGVQLKIIAAAGAQTTVGAPRGARRRAPVHEPARGSTRAAAGSPVRTWSDSSLWPECGRPSAAWASGSSEAEAAVRAPQDQPHDLGAAYHSLIRLERAQRINSPARSRSGVPRSGRPDRCTPAWRDGRWRPGCRPAPRRRRRTGTPAPADSPRTARACAVRRSPP
jgi:hypothetical protein